MSSRITPIADIVKSVFAKLDSQKDLLKEDVEGSWKNLVGDGGFKHSRPVALRGTVLTVRVDSSGWMQELAMQKRRILKGLKRVFGKDRISEIRFKIGEW